MLPRLVIFGATGDLAGRYLLPGLAALHEAGELPDGFEVIGTGQRDLSREEFLDGIAGELDEHAPDLPAGARGWLLGTLDYRSVDVTDAGSVRDAVCADGTPAAVYLALPPAVYAPATGALGAAGLPEGSRVAYEKPFGEDLASARELNGLIERCLGGGVAFRVDHFLALPGVRRIAERRRDPRTDEHWGSEHVEQVEIHWEETLALEGRASYYEGTGQLRDMVQNHLMQVVCALAVEPPTASGEELREARIDTLRAVRVPETAEAVRARYGEGEIGGRAIPAYADEEGVDDDSATETFARVELEVNTARWSGVPFVLRTGKALARERMEVVLRRRDGEQEALPLQVEDPDGLPEYAHVLRDLLSGGSAISVSGPAAEEAWRIVEPVLEAWERGDSPLREYPAGSEGP